MSFATKIIQSRGSTVFLVLAPFPDKRNAWYFIRVQPAKVSTFRRVVASGPVNLEDYGEILQRGWGEKPPEYIVNEMREKYGYIPEETNS